MIITTLPVGTWIRTRYHGEWEYSRIVALDGGYGMQLGPDPAPGTLVQTCVWKGTDAAGNDILEPRGKPITFKGRAA